MTVDHVGSAKFVTKLNLLKGYWQVPLTPHTFEICAFVTPAHFLQYTVMPFWLRNAPDTFQQLMNTVLRGVKYCEVYLDDIVAYLSVCIPLTSHSVWPNVSLEKPLLPIWVNKWDRVVLALSLPRCRQF